MGHFRHGESAIAGSSAILLDPHPAVLHGRFDPSERRIFKDAGAALFLTPVEAGTATPEDVMSPKPLGGLTRAASAGALPSSDG